MSRPQWCRGHTTRARPGPSGPASDGPGVPVEPCNVHQRQHVRGARMGLEQRTAAVHDNAVVHGNRRTGKTSVTRPAPSRLSSLFPPGTTSFGPLSLSCSTAATCSVVATNSSGTVVGAFVTTNSGRTWSASSLPAGSWYTTLGCFPEWPLHLGRPVRACIQHKWRAHVVVGDRLPRSWDARIALVQQRLGLHGDGDRQTLRRGSTGGSGDKRWWPPLVHRQS